jgi:hypothetical protein
MKELQELLQDRISMTAIKWHLVACSVLGFLWVILVTV